MKQPVTLEEVIKELETDICTCKYNLLEIAPDADFDKLEETEKIVVDFWLHKIDCMEYALNILKKQKENDNVQEK